jgi:hypothetical protein
MVIVFPRNQVGVGPYILRVRQTRSFDISVQQALEALRR